MTRDEFVQRLKTPAGAELVQKVILFSPLEEWDDVAAMRRRVDCFLALFWARQDGATSSVINHG